MSSGLFALLDDVAALVKAGAASLDDVSAQVTKTTSKVSGIVIDDTAVTPKYVVGLDPSREVSIIYNIARKSLVNKLIFLGPAALLLGFLAPWAIQPLLMLGGAYLCFEGFEKVHSIFFPHHHGEEEDAEDFSKITPEELEKMRIDSAVRTDFILSSEIIAITYANVADQDFLTKVVVVVVVAITITIAVYGVVGLIVKADDFGLFLARKKKSSFVSALGRGIVRVMPGFLVALSYLGTAAMLWVGAEIIAHGIPPAHHALEALEKSLASLPVLAWFAKVTVSAIAGIVIGFVVAKVVGLVGAIIGRFRSRKEGDNEETPIVEKAEPSENTESE
ncbi:MAG: DUF808 domain-containing protein [Pyrinomonadaceae bacterium]